MRALVDILFQDSARLQTACIPTGLAELSSAAQLDFETLLQVPTRATREVETL
jgi:hypothetical protein